jgi:hypothetical protein
MLTHVVIYMHAYICGTQICFTCSKILMMRSQFSCIQRIDSFGVEVVSLAILALLFTAQKSPRRLNLLYYDRHRISLQVACCSQIKVGPHMCNNL